MERAQLAKEIYRASYLTGDFTLRSGAHSHEYFDKYLFESDPRLLGAIAESLAGMVPAGTEAFAGLELGGVPLATALSRVTGLPALFVRKEAKPYGTRHLAEGGQVAARLTVVEDVITSGGQVVKSCQDLRSRGSTVEHALCVIDREQGGRDALARIGVAMLALYTMAELKGIAGA